MPSSPDSEKGVLSSIVLAPVQSFQSILSSGITKDAFYIPAHQTIFTTISELHQDGKPADFITITQKLRDQNNLDQCGGASFINELFVYLPTAANIAYYLDVVLEKYLARQALELSVKLREGIGDGQHPSEVLAGIQSDILNVLTKEKPSRKTVKQVVREICEEVVAGKDDDAKLLTGIDPIDAELNLFRSDYLVIPGPTSSGKSSLACQIALSMAKRGARTLVFALEMSTKQIIKRALAMESGYNSEAVRRMAVSNRDLRGITRSEAEVHEAVTQFSAAALKIANLDLTVIDDANTLESILAISRAHSAQKPLDLLVVDYPALLQSTGNFERRQLALAHAANSFKRFANEIHGLVITPSQVNKDGGTREAADFEHAANAILSVGFNESDDSERTVTITKQRDGARGQQLPLTWHGLTTSFRPKTSQNA